MTEFIGVLARRGIAADEPDNRNDTTDCTGKCIKEITFSNIVI